MCNHKVNKGHLLLDSDKDLQVVDLEDQGALVEDLGTEGHEAVEAADKEADFNFVFVILN